jgi:cytochrome c556
MKNVVAVQTQIIWDLGNQAQDDKGNPDASKLKPADWSRIIQASTQVKQAAETLATAKHVRAAGPGEKLQSEGNPGAFGGKEVQAVIDAKPEAFRAFAHALATSLDPVTAAARTKDAAKLFDSSGAIDQICEDCHVQFWYPNQKNQ